MTIGTLALSNWRHRLPNGFRLCQGTAWGLTHRRLLYTPETWLQRIAMGWHELGDKCQRSLETAHRQ
jgi:hypothetical protein